MIKDFETYINEDYFSKLANRKDKGNVRKENEITEDFVRSYLNEEWFYNLKSINIRKEGNETIVDIDGDFALKQDVEEIPFQFGTVTGNFDCAYSNIKSLKGCPEKTGMNFNCYHCLNLSSLEGCPKEVGNRFVCGNCGKKFTEEEVSSLCKVKGVITV